VAEGYCQPFSFDITTAVRPGVANSIAIVCTRAAQNEFGTGGLLGLVSSSLWGAGSSASLGFGAECLREIAEAMIT